MLPRVFRRAHGTAVLAVLQAFLLITTLVLTPAQAFAQANDAEARAPGRSRTGRRCRAAGAAPSLELRLFRPRLRMPEGRAQARERLHLSRGTGCLRCGPDPGHRGRRLRRGARLLVHPGRVRGARLACPVAQDQGHRAERLQEHRHHRPSWRPGRPGGRRRARAQGRSGRRDRRRDQAAEGRAQGRSARRRAQVDATEPPADEPKAEPPADEPKAEPSAQPTEPPADEPKAEPPADEPKAEPTAEPTDPPADEPTTPPTGNGGNNDVVQPEPSVAPAESPASNNGSVEPSAAPSVEPAPVEDQAGSTRPRNNDSRVSGDPAAFDSPFEVAASVNVVVETRMANHTGQNNGTTGENCIRYSPTSGGSATSWVDANDNPATAWTSHGHQGQSCPGSLSISTQSAVGFSPTNATSIATSTAFLLGLMTHSNNPIQARRPVLPGPARRPPLRRHGRRGQPDASPGRSTRHPTTPARTATRPTTTSRPSRTPPEARASTSAVSTTSSCCSASASQRHRPDRRHPALLPRQSERQPCQPVPHGRRHPELRLPLRRARAAAPADHQEGRRGSAARGPTRPSTSARPAP